MKSKKKVSQERKNDKMERTRKNIILLTVAFILVAIIGATFAYFTAQIGSGANVDIKANTDTVDALRFEVDGALTINANMDNFYQGAGNAEGSTKARAILLANNTNNTATYNYYVYLDIEDNDFVYTKSEEQTPELVLVVKDPTGKYLDTLGELKKTNVDIIDKDSLEEEKQTKQVTGFDITTKTGLIKLSDDNEVISASSENPEETEEWEVTIVFVNFDKEQNENTNKELNAKLYIQAEERPAITITADEIKDTSMKVTASIDSKKEISKIQFKTSDSEEWQEGSTVTTIALGEQTYTSEYTFTNLEKGKKYQINVKAIDVDNNETTKNKKEKTLEVSSSPTLVDYIKSQFTDKETEVASGDKGKLYYHSTDLDGGAKDNSYRYAGNNPNNFVCLGEIQGDGSCDNVQNLYRIIGMFPFQGNEQQTSYSEGMEYRIKLIKSEYITEKELKGSDGTGDGETLSSSETELARVETKTGIHGFKWNTEVYTNKDNWYNLWEYGEQKATLNTALNGTYLTNLENKIGSNKIADTTWNIGGNTIYSVTPKAMYDAEMNAEGTGTTYKAPQTTSQAKIGLMYVSDYGFAASSTSTNDWATQLYDYGDYTETTDKENNWLFNGVYEWTISRYSDNSYFAFNVGSDGNVGNGDVDGDAHGVRPVFYLDSVTKLKSGESADGSQAHPYGIE